MRTAVCILIVSGLCFAQGPQPPSSSSKADVNMTAPPKAKIETVIDDYHGHKVADPYRWLENSQSPDTQHFVDDENAYTRQVLEVISGRDKLRSRLERLVTIGRVAAPKARGRDYSSARPER